MDSSWDFYMVLVLGLLKWGEMSANAKEDLTVT
jgi:hypothetical protein